MSEAKELVPGMSMVTQFFVVSTSKPASLQPKALPRRAMVSRAFQLPAPLIGKIPLCRTASLHTFTVADPGHQVVGSRHVPLIEEIDGVYRQTIYGDAARLQGAWVRQIEV
ncbi:MAG: hypothetical protein ACLVC5_09590 [Clostridia bacterium]